MQIESIPQGSRALLTGGGGGVGLAIAQVLLAQGFRVQLFGRTKATLDAAASELPGEVLVSTGDVSLRADLDAAVKAGSDWGPVRVLIHAAGIAESAPLLPPDDDLWDRTIATNLTGAWVSSTACLPGMQDPSLPDGGGGVIIHIASTAALRGYRFTAAYVASKHGVAGLVRAMAEDLSRTTVRVHAICPGFLDTPMTDRTIANVVASTGKSTDEARGMIAKMNASGALIKPEAVAALAWELIADNTRRGEVIPLE